MLIQSPNMPSPEMFLTCKNRINLKPHRPKKEEIAQADVLLIRHAVSTFNYLTCETRKKYGPKSKVELVKEHRNTANIDPPLHVVGRYQCE